MACRFLGNHATVLLINKILGKCCDITQVWQAERKIVNLILQDMTKVDTIHLTEKFISNGLALIQWVFFLSYFKRDFELKIGVI